MKKGPFLWKNNLDDQKATQAKSFKDLKALYDRPLMELLRQASSVHTAHWPANKLQQNTLISIKTGHCPEDCSYCPQSARYKTSIETNKLMTQKEVLEKAKKAKGKWQLTSLPWGRLERSQRWRGF